MFSILYDFIAKFILLRKYYLVIIWYLDIRNSKRIIDFKDWLLKRKGLTTNNINAINKKKLKLLSFIKFRFNLLKNIQSGMNVFFSHNNKYTSKDFEYLDIFHNGVIRNNESIGEVIVWKKKMWNLFKNFSNHLINLKTLYFNKRLWAAYKIVKRKYFKNTHFQFKLFSEDYWRTNIKLDRFYKTHLKWGHIKNSIAPKFYKFFVIYNFLKFKRLSTKRFPKDILNSVFFKLILDQILPRNLEFNISFKDDKIKYQKNLNFFSFQNLYKLYNIPQKINVLFRSLYLFNQKNWNYWPDWKKKHFLDSIKYYQYLKHIRTYNIFSIKQLEQRLSDLNLYFLSYKKKYINLDSKFIEVYDKLIYIYKKYWKFHKNIYPHKHYIVSSSKATDFINKIKYKFFIKNLLNLIKDNVNIEIWKSNKFNLFIFSHIFLKFVKFSFSYFNNFFNLFFFNIFLNVFKRIIKKDSIIDLIKNNTDNYNEDNLNFKKINLKSISMILKKLNLNNKSNNKQQEIYDFIKKFTVKKKKFLHYSNKYKKKKKISIFNQYDSYKYKIDKHPFYNIIKYEYSLYLKKNPYKNDSENYFHFINFNNFIKWKRKNIINNINWKIFYKYSPNNKLDFFRDLFIRYKSFLKKKSIYKSTEYNSLFYVSKQNNIIKNPKYYLGWFVFNQPIKLKNWFYQKNFFLFPTWFYNYEKKKSLFLNFDYEIFKKEMEEVESELFKDIKKSILYSKFYKKFYNLNKSKNFLKAILNFYRIAANIKIYKNFKKDLLIEKLIYIDKHLNLNQRDNIINKIRFNKFIKWNNKKKIINSLESRFDNALTFNQKKISIKNIFNTKRYNFEDKKRQINKKLNNWNKLNKLRNLRQKRIKNYLNKNSNNEIIKAYNDIINFNSYTKIEIKKYYMTNKKMGINNRIISDYLIFNKIYQNKLLNNTKINSSLNNLFYKFYNVPKIMNYNKIKNYFTNYKIRTKNLIYDKQIIKNLDNNLKNNDLVLNKNYTNNLVIDLSKFVKMYGFRWW